MLETLRRLPNPSTAAVDDLEAAIAAAEVPASDRDPFEARTEH